jgi:hypothetical protein
MNKRTTLAIGAAALAALMLAGTAAAADPTPSPTPAPIRDRDRGGTVADVLDLTPAQVRELRLEGLSLAQIAERQKVAVERLVEALTSRWTERIEVRVQRGALTDEQAATLVDDLTTRAETMVNNTAPGGMRGAAVGAGPANGAGPGGGGQMRRGAGGNGPGTGTGVCDGTGQSRP